MPTRTPLFPLGQIVATPLALATLLALNVQPSDLLDRHVAGDWGDICPGDRGLNERAVHRGERILSVYRLAPEHTIWIITNGADDAGARDATTLLCPEEY